MSELVLAGSSEDGSFLAVLSTVLLLPHTPTYMLTTDISVTQGNCWTKRQQECQTNWQHAHWSHVWQDAVPGCTPLWPDTALPKIFKVIFSFFGVWLVQSLQNMGLKCCTVLLPRAVSPCQPGSLCSFSPSSDISQPEPIRGEEWG